MWVFLKDNCSITIRKLRVCILYIYLKDLLYVTFLPEFSSNLKPLGSQSRKWKPSVQ